ncbi:MAG TPA: cellulase family glycosylhydrolase [Chitinophagaceae bacterium]|nr:cellulase family glycosylhydrolase [Chitinophagaceae bacterium]
MISKTSIPSVRLIYLLLCIVIPFIVVAQTRPESDEAFKQNARLGRGVNIIGYDPRWKDPSKSRMNEDHFRKIKAAGFDNVRIVISPFRFSMNDSSYTIAPEFFTTLDWTIRESLKNNLMAIVDFHEHIAMQKDPRGNKAKLLAMWKQIADHCSGLPYEVVFEICNEPNMEPSTWNEIQAEALKILRKSNPGRTIIIGSINGNQIKYLDNLVLPDNDRNIIVAIHYYSPIQFTHQGAPWSVKNKDLSGIEWTASETEMHKVDLDFDQAQKWAKVHRRPLTLGEFGAYEKADMPSRVRWTNYIARQAEARNWSWSYWQFDSDFVVYDIENNQWVEPILKALIPQKALDLKKKRSFIPAGYKGEAFHDQVHLNGPQVIPGKIECAFYDLGGEGVAFHDLESQNRGSGGLNLEPNHHRPHATPYEWGFRKEEGVDLSYTKDFADFNHSNNYYVPAVNQFYIGWTENNEWVNYTVDVKVAGLYTIDALYSFNDTTITFDVDQLPASTCKLPVNTGSFHAWNKGVIGTIEFREPGLHLLTFHYNKGNNFAYFEFTLTGKRSDVGK